MRGSALLGDGRYVFVGGAPFASDAGVLIDGSTGRQTLLSFPGCNSPFAAGGPWLVYTCGTGTSQQLEFYRISTGESQAVTINPSLGSPGCANALQCVGVPAVGADWIALTTGDAGCEEHCLVSYEFQNIETGNVVSDPSNRRTTVNLNYLGLSQRVCSPVIVPYAAADEVSPPPGWGSVTFDGRFAIVAGPGGVYLEQCGSRLREFLTYPTSFNTCAEPTCPPPSNSHLIVWESAPGRLSGLFLPDRQRFVIHLPARVDPQATNEQFVSEDQYRLALTARALYLQDQQGQIWRTANPSLPVIGKGSRR